MPKPGDAEVVTMATVGEFMGKGQAKSIWRHFRNHWHGWFPRLGSRANFAKQNANTWALKKRIQDTIAWQTGATDGTARSAWPTVFRCRSASRPAPPAAVVSSARRGLAIARQRMRSIAKAT